MGNVYLKPRQTAILIDIDGTISTNPLTIPHVTDDILKDRKKFFKKVAFYNHDMTDYIQPLKGVVELIKLYMLRGVIPIFITARSDAESGLIRENTKAFIEEQFGKIEDGQLLMREENDIRPNYVTKKELYETFVKDKFEVICAFDDEINNVNMFKDEGILVLQPHLPLIIDN